MSRYVNTTNTVKTLFLQRQAFGEWVNVIGSWIVIIDRCTFHRGLRIISAIPDYYPRRIEITRSEFPVLTWEQPLKINGLLGSTPIPYVLLDGVEISGSGKPYRNDSLSESGTPDNVGIHGCKQLHIFDTWSIRSGENNFSLTDCDDIYLKSVRSLEADGQGFHIGRHNSKNRAGSVGELLVDGCLSAGNFRNQLSVAGSGCGFLLHNVRDASIYDFVSEGNEYGVSHQVRPESGKARLRFSGSVFGARSEVITSSNVEFVAVP